MVSTVLDRLQRLGPVFHSKDAVGAGVSWRDLYRLRDDGRILELSRGVYQLVGAEGDNLDFVTVCARAPRGMICLNSAMAYWALSDEIPTTVHLAVTEGSHRPTIDYPPTTVHTFGRANFERGRTEVRLDDGGRFWTTDRERTVVDAFRLRHLIGEDLAHGALRRYVGAEPKLARLAELARELRAWTSVGSALRVLHA